MLEIRINPQPAASKLEKFSAEVKAALYEEASKITAKLLEKMIAKASGGVTQVRTGKYLGSFKSKVSESSAGIIGRVLNSDPIANILESGAHIPPHLIAARNGHALHFLDQKAVALGFLPTAGDVFASVVHSPGATIAPHSVIYSTFEEEEGEITEGLNSVTEKATRDSDVA